MNDDINLASQSTTAARKPLWEQNVNGVESTLSCTCMLYGVMAPVRDLDSAFPVSLSPHAPASGIKLSDYSNSTTQPSDLGLQELPRNRSVNLVPLCSWFYAHSWQIVSLSQYNYNVIFWSMTWHECYYMTAKRYSIAYKSGYNGSGHKNAALSEFRQ